MQKKRITTLALVAFVLLVSGSSAHEAASSQDDPFDALPGGGWWTGIQVQNVNPTPSAVARMMVYTHSGEQHYLSVEPTPAPSFASRTFLPATELGIPQHARGAGIVTADQPIRTIVNLTNRLTGSYGISGGKAGGQFHGVSRWSGSTSLHFPIAKSNFVNKSSTFFIQNAGYVGANLDATFHCPAGNYPYSGFLDPGHMYVLDPGMAGVPSASPGQNCSLTVTSSQQMVGVSAEHWTSESPATLLQTTNGFTMADYNTVLYVPAVKKDYTGPNDNHGRSTGIQIQNVTQNTIHVQITFTYAADYCSGHSGQLVVSQDIPPLFQWAIIPYSDLGEFPFGCIATAKLEATTESGPDLFPFIVAVINESYLPPPAVGVQSATSHAAFPDHTVTTLVSAPLFKKTWSNKNSELYIMNTSPTYNATVYAYFMGATPYTRVYSIPPMGLRVVVNPDIDTGNYGVKLVSYYSTPATRAKIVATVVEAPLINGLPCYGELTCYDRQSYEGFNLVP